MQAANESGSWDSVVLDAAKGGSDRQTESVEISRRPAKQPGDKGGQSDESDNTSLREKSSAGANAGLGEAPVSVEENTETPRKVFGDVRALTLSKGEAEAMEKLAPYLGGSPRRGKRFVNVYRLIKSSLDSKALSKLGADDPTPAWALLAQLAIATGAPALAARYFEKLQTARTLSLLRKDLENDGILAASPQARDLLGALGRSPRCPGGSLTKPLPLSGSRSTRRSPAATHSLLEGEERPRAQINLADVLDGHGCRDVLAEALNGGSARHLERVDSALTFGKRLSWERSGCP